VLFGPIIKLRARSLDEDGQALVEYSLILLLVALVAVPILTQIGVNVVGPFTTAANAL
jgi:Flp pilus assembly pilin Flp